MSQPAVGNVKATNIRVRIGITLRDVPATISGAVIDKNNL